MCTRSLAIQLTLSTFTTPGWTFKAPRVISARLRDRHRRPLRPPAPAPSPRRPRPYPNSSLTPRQTPTRLRRRPLRSCPPCSVAGVLLPEFAAAAGDHAHQTVRRVVTCPGVRSLPLLLRRPPPPPRVLQRRARRRQFHRATVQADPGPDAEAASPAGRAFG